MVEYVNPTKLNHCLAIIWHLQNYEPNANVIASNECNNYLSNSYAVCINYMFVIED